MALPQRGATHLQNFAEACDTVGAVRVAAQNLTQRHEDTKNTKGLLIIHEPLSAKEEHIAKEIVDAAYTVHQTLGPGLLEQIYEVCFCHELKKRGLSSRCQVSVPINYDGIKFDEGLRLDVLVEELVICELKAVEQMHPIFTAQLLSQLRLTGKRLGFLINFTVPKIKEGIKRVIL